MGRGRKELVLQVLQSLQGGVEDVASVFLEASHQKIPKGKYRVVLNGAYSTDYSYFFLYDL